MPSLVGYKIRHGDFDYSADLTWDDDAFAGGGITFGLDIGRSSIEPPPKTQSLASLSISIEEFEGAPVLVIAGTVYGEGFETRPIPLREFYTEDQILEAAIEAIPGVVFGAGEPITGCLIRAGLSSVLGHIITCKNATADFNWFINRTSAIGTCLKDHAPSIGATMIGRAIRCAMLN